MQNNSGMPDEALLLTCSLGHVSGWLESKNSALEANQASRPGGAVLQGGLQGKISNLCKTSF